MPDIRRIIVLIVLTLLIAACGTAAAPTPARSVLPAPQISRHPEPAGPADLCGFCPELTAIPKFDPYSMAPWVDLRSRDLTKIDMTGSSADLAYAVFDSKTQWPSADKIPADFDWQKFMETGKDPGLGIRELHQWGITGKGVNIAIIDQPLLIEHSEYTDRVRLYEEINVPPGTKAQMHGPGVASLAVGRTIGAAPDANLYYIATFNFDPSGRSQNPNYRYDTQALRRILEINQELPEDQKIRAVSISWGLHPTVAGYDEFISAIEAAREAGIFVITADLNPTYGWNMMGMGRNPGSDPNDFQSYEPEFRWQENFFEQGFSKKTLLLPMDSRTVASPTGIQDYVFFGPGGMSWVAPYLAGMYALAIQVEPGITPEEFWATALETGRTIQIQHDGKDYEFGVILDPQALIEALKSK